MQTAGRACFLTTSAVERADGVVVRFADVAVGTAVRVAPAVSPAAFCLVYLFTPKLVSDDYPYVWAVTASGAALTASPGQLAQNASPRCYVTPRLRSTRADQQPNQAIRRGHPSRVCHCTHLQEFVLPSLELLQNCRIRSRLVSPCSTLLPEEADFHLIVRAFCGTCSVVRALRDMLRHAGIFRDVPRVLSPCGAMATCRRGAR